MLELIRIEVLCIVLFALLPTRVDTALETAEGERIVYLPLRENNYQHLLGTLHHGKKVLAYIHPIHLPENFKEIEKRYLHNSLNDFFGYLSCQDFNLVVEKTTEAPGGYRILRLPACADPEAQHF